MQKGILRLKVMGYLHCMWVMYGLTCICMQGLFAQRNDPNPTKKTLIYDYVYIRNDSSFKMYIKTNVGFPFNDWDLIPVSDAIEQPVEENLFFYVDKIGIDLRTIKLMKDFWGKPLQGKGMSTFYLDSSDTPWMQTEERRQGISSYSKRDEKGYRLNIPACQIFHYLELNPHAYIRFNSDSWKVYRRIGERYDFSPEILEALDLTQSPKRLLKWDKKINIHHQYTNLENSFLDTALGRLDCRVVEAYAQSEMGRSSMIAYYHDRYGFVKISYDNVDGSQLILDLMEVR